MNGCAYISGLIILLANMFELPDAETVSTDKRLTQHAIGMFNRMKETSDNDYITRMNDIIKDLDRRAHGAVDKIAGKKRKAEESGMPWIPTEELQRITEDRASILRSEGEMADLSAFVGSHPGATDDGVLGGLLDGSAGSPFVSRTHPPFLSVLGHCSLSWRRAGVSLPALACLMVGLLSHSGMLLTRLLPI